MLGSNPAPRRHRRNRLLAIGAAASLLAAALTAGQPTASASPTADPAHIDSELAAALAAGGTTEFLVYLPESADLSGAATLDQKEAKTTHVYQRLTATARTSQADLRATLDARGIAYTSFWIANALLVEGDQALAEELAARPDVASIAADSSYPLIEPTREPGTGAPGTSAVEWGVSNINADQVWGDVGITGDGIVVASIDTGVQFDHPALVGQYRGTTTGSHDYNWFDPAAACESTAPCDNNGHGTHVTGTMVGDDGGENQIGVAPDAQWIAAKGCEDSSCSTSSLLAAGQWMVAPTDLDGGNADPAMAPDIVNNSWGGGSGDPWYQATIEAWVSAGIFPMFAAGNIGPDCGSVNSPGDNLPAYAVGAYDINENIAIFSGRGPSGMDSAEIKPDAAAPGVGIRSSVPTDGYANLSGTSMASPHAAGIVALVWSASVTLRGDIDATREVLDSTARDTADDQCGGTAANNNVFGEGRLDALAAVIAANAADPAPDPTGFVR